MRPLIVMLLTLTPVPALAQVHQSEWGKTASGQTIPLYTISDGRSQADVTPQGARLVAWRVPDKAGHLGNVVVGPASADKATGLMGVAGATMGRYANRVAAGRLEIDGKTWQLALNNKGNTLHGGPLGFHTQLWSAQILHDGVRFSRVSPEGEMGFPGTLSVSVTYRLIRHGNEDELSITYQATTTSPTVVNLTNHAFFDLSSGQGPAMTTGSIAARTYAVTQPADGIPTGKIAPVTGQPWDFTKARRFDPAVPIDVSLVLDRVPHGPVAIFSDAATGRTMRVFTQEPSAQLFVPVAGGKAWAFCFETQHLPDSPHQPAFPSTLLRPGRTFLSMTRYVIVSAAGAGPCVGLGCRRFRGANGGLASGYGAVKRAS